MKHTRRLRPSPAMVVACCALLVALGGTSIAAVNVVLPRNSVGAAQLRANAVTSEKVRDNSLTLGDFEASERLRLTGLSGYRREWSTVMIRPGDSQVLTAECSKGANVLSGGVTPSSEQAVVWSSAPVNDTTWSVGVSNPTDERITARAWAICARVTR